VTADAAASTRDKLLDAATRLFAERGINGVPLAEIVREAGQRNASAVHYHFGGRDEVLLAILERHVPALRARRLALLEAARSAPAADVRAVAEAIVRPVCELAEQGWRERAYLRIGAELTGTLDRTPKEVRSLLRRTGGHEAMALLAERCPGIPTDVWAERAAIGYAFIGRAAADRARLLDTRRARSLPGDRWVENLVDMFVGAMTAPVRAPLPELA
jgi:AcrR family transcriptional regulator